MREKYHLIMKLNYIILKIFCDWVEDFNKVLAEQLKIHFCLFLSIRYLASFIVFPECQSKQYLTHMEVKDCLAIIMSCVNLLYFLFLQNILYNQAVGKT